MATRRHEAPGHVRTTVAERERVVFVEGLTPLPVPTVITIGAWTGDEVPVARVLEGTFAIVAEPVVTRRHLSSGPSTLSCIQITNSTRQSISSESSLAATTPLPLLLGCYLKSYQVCGCGSFRVIACRRCQGAIHLFSSSWPVPQSLTLAEGCVGGLGESADDRRGKHPLHQSDGHEYDGH